MAQKVRRKPSVASRRKSPASSRRALTMFMFGGSIEALSGFKLPAGAEVAIVSSKPESVRQIRKRVSGRFSRITEVVASERGDVRRLEKTFVDEAAFEPDARSRAMLKGVRIAQEDLREAGGAYDLDQVRMLMRGVSRQAIDKRVQEGSLLAVPGPSNRRSYPTLQFNPDGTVAAGLKAVREALQTSNPWTVLNFLSRPDSRLGNRKPIDVLKSGDVGRVVEAARRHGEQGA